MSEKRGNGSDIRDETHRMAEELRRDYEAALRKDDGDAEAGSLRQVLTVHFGDDVYALETRYCREVLRVPAVVPVPHVPSTVLGVINLRGNVVSVSDVRRLLDIEPGEPTGGARLVVVSNGGVSTAILVDRVGTIVDVPEDEIQQAPRAFSGKRKRFLAGQCLRDDALLTFIDVDELLSAPEMIVDREKGS